MSAYFKAQHVNMAAGGVVVTPWEVQDLPAEWLDGAEALIARLPQAKKAQAVIDQKLAAWRAKHPGYAIKH